ncbi:hypothetical protein P378_05480 [Desulforamulus profundi]|uniref:Uncharacterized protein n=1 Tax=Desulforamulus profundi TaxID=1383067 RepID=A0A2C6MHV9_9FIRM|nr:hypothetical protein P378_05480 [Desulforamulus profundi]
MAFPLAESGKAPSYFFIDLFDGPLSKSFFTKNSFCKNEPVYLSQTDLASYNATNCSLFNLDGVYIKTGEQGNLSCPVCYR